MAALLTAMASSGEQHHKDRHGNPGDLEGYIARMEEPSRAEWQKPDEVLRALEVRAGQVACDVGAGPGYFSLRLARAVGEAGQVYAVDVEPRILAALRDRLRDSGARNVTSVLSLLADAAAAGLQLVREHDFLPYQYFVVLAPNPGITPPQTPR